MIYNSRGEKHALFYDWTQARSWSIPTVDPYEEAARQALGQASPPPSPAYPLPVDDPLAALSPSHIVDADPEEDPEEDPADHPSDGGDDDDDDESFEDDADDDDEEAFEEEDDDEEEEEHLAPADSSVVHVVDLVPSAEDTEAFKTDESAPTLVPSPRCRTARMSVRPQTPMSAIVEALIAEYAYAPTPPSPPPSPLTPLSSPLPQILSPPLPLPSPPTHTSLTYAEAPLGYIAAGIREDVPEADVSPRKRLCLTTPTPRCEIEESSTTTAVRQPGSSVARGADYEERAMAAVRVVNLRVSYQADVRRRDNEESEAHNRALEARIATMETQLYHMQWQRQDTDDRATGAMMRIHVLEHKAHIDTLEDTGSSA
ncbi:hypothetical protein Tco_0729194 [Tanacetum coccineum]|uniref:Uncharacterized protein n=1 Tax=Tanacetum coccineum TaxID=301880 RepID=A0ABQ4YRQ8_9ASTR